MAGTAGAARPFGRRSSTPTKPGCVARSRVAEPVTAKPAPTPPPRPRPPPAGGQAPRPPPRPPAAPGAAPAAPPGRPAPAPRAPRAPGPGGAPVPAAAGVQAAADAGRDRRESAERKAFAF